VHILTGRELTVQATDSFLFPPVFLTPCTPIAAMDGMRGSEFDMGSSLISRG
jgi:hypothetical protein